MRIRGWFHNQMHIMQSSSVSRMEGWGLVSSHDRCGLDLDLVFMRAFVVQLDIEEDSTDNDMEMCFLSKIKSLEHDSLGIDRCRLY